MKTALATKLEIRGILLRRRFCCELNVSLGLSSFWERRGTAGGKVQHKNSLPAKLATGKNLALGANLWGCKPPWKETIDPPETPRQSCTSPSACGANGTS